MAGEQEQLQFLGFFGIFNESYKIIFSWKKISQITLSLIFPLCFIFLAHVHISDFLLNLLGNEIELYDDWSGSPTIYHELRRKLSSQWTLLWLFSFAYLLFALVFSLLSTSAIVYTIACIYTFKKVMSVVPKVWKRLVITFLWNFLILLVYNVVAIVLLILSILLAGSRFAFPRNMSFFVVLISSLMGFIYFNVIWHLASVVSVLEDMNGLKSMKKSKGLIKGNLLVASVLFVLFQGPIIATQIVYEIFVVDGKHYLGIGSRVVVGIACFLVLFKLTLLGLVVTTVVYFVCKSYHHENISKSGLAEHLDCYSGEYVPLTGKHVQLGELGA